MKGAGDERPDAAVEVLLPPDARRAETGPVEGVPEGDRLETAGHELRQLQGHLDRVRPARAEEERHRSPGVISASFFARRTAGMFV